MSNILSALGQLLSPIGNIFHTIFYEPIYNILMLLYHVINAVGIPGSFALAIIVLTLLIRCALIPLTRKQLKSSRAMQELAPQLNALKVQYRGDPQGLMQAQQALYKEHGYSPVSGCLPLLIQLPFLYALYYSFWNILRTSAHETVAQHLAAINNDIYPFLPHLTHLPNTQFLWTNLATPDPIHVLPILAGLFTLIQLRMAMPVRKKPAPGAPKDPTTQATQTTMYIMPLITVFFGWTFPAGLALYWTVGAIFASVQQYFLTGLGSLFLGIPGFEHLVPEPKEPPTSNLALAGGARSNTSNAANTSRAGARSLVAASAAPEEQKGIRGFFRQMREMSAAAQAQAEETAKARREGQVVESAAPKNGNAAKSASVSSGETAKKTDISGSGTASRRPRSAAKDAPMLVKPPSSPSKPAKAELPEDAIKRDATTAAAKSEPLPEVAIAQTANGKNGQSGASANGRTTASATVVRPAGGPKGSGGNNTNGNGARKSGGNGSGKGSAARNRTTNRPKGGR